MPISRRKPAKKKPKPAKAVSAPPPAVASAAPAAANIAGATISLSYAQVRELESAVEDAQRQTKDLQRQLAEAKALDPTGLVVDLRDLAREQIKVMQFAIANLPPSDVPKWPFAALERIALLMVRLPDFGAIGDDDQTLQTEIGFFVAEIKEAEAERSRKQADLIANAPSEIRRPPVRLTVAVNNEGTCNCTPADLCPIGRKDDDPRCTSRDLLAANVTCVPTGQSPTTASAPKT